MSKSWHLYAQYILDAIEKYSEYKRVGIFKAMTFYMTLHCAICKLYLKPRKDYQQI